MNTENFIPQPGMNVFGSDGEKVGEINTVEQDYFVVTRGFFFPRDLFLALSSVDSFEDNNVYLNVTRDVAIQPDGGEQTRVSYDWSNLGASSAGLGRRDSGPVYKFGDGVTDVSDSSYGETRVDDPTYGEADFGNHAYTEISSREVQRSRDVPGSAWELQGDRRPLDRPAD